MRKAIAAAVRTDEGLVHFFPPPCRHHHTLHALHKDSGALMPGLGGVLLTYAVARRRDGRLAGWLAALVLGTALLYFALSLPSVGNFGVREFTWAALFERHGAQDALFAYAFATNAIFLLLMFVLTL